MFKVDMKMLDIKKNVILNKAMHMEYTYLLDFSIIKIMIKTKKIEWLQYQWNEELLLPL